MAKARGVLVRKLLYSSSETDDRRAMKTMHGREHKTIIQRTFVGLFQPIVDRQNSCANDINDKKSKNNDCIAKRNLHLFFCTPFDGALHPQRTKHTHTRCKSYNAR